MAYTDWSRITPTDGTRVRQVDDSIRALSTAIRERYEDLISNPDDDTQPPQLQAGTVPPGALKDNSVVLTNMTNESVGEAELTAAVKALIPRIKASGSHVVPATALLASSSATIALGAALADAEGFILFSFGRAIVGSEINTIYNAYIDPATFVPTLTISNPDDTNTGGIGSPLTVNYIVLSTVWP